MSWDKNSSGVNLPPDILTKVFPFYIAFDQTMQLVQIGESIQRLCPNLAIGKPVQQHFWLKHPHVPFEFGSVYEEINSLFLLENIDTGLQFKGQTIYAGAQKLIFFLGSPWVADSHSLSALGRKLANLSSRGTASDLLVLLQARGTSLADTRRLAEKMAAQKTELRQALRQAELATAVLEQAADAVEIMDADGNILYVNFAFERITGFPRDEILGKATMDLLQPGEHEESFYQDMWRTVREGQVWQGSFIGKRKDGALYHQEATIFPVHNKVEKITNYVAIRRDISDRKRTQEELGNSLSLLQTTFEATADGILVTNTKGHVLNFNQKFVDLWQVSEATLTSSNHRRTLGFVEEFLKEPNLFAGRIKELYTQPQAESYDILELRDGRILEGRSRPQRMGDTVIGRVWSFRDITERQRSEEQIRYQALHDMLTGLPNRTLFNDRLSLALSSAQQHHSQLAVLFLDLDRFKLINDTLGHAAGDLLLQGFAHRITACINRKDTLARWAGDEFTLLLPNIQGLEEATTIAQRILDALKPDFEIDGHTLRVSSSIGIAVYPQDGEDAETLLKNADAALYRAKESGRNGYHIYTSAINSEASEWLALENHLHRALERQEFVLYYQPQVNVITGEIIQMEALVRWKHPEMGLVPPNRFIPLAEETGLIAPLGEWVLRTACRQNRLWQEAGLPAIRIAVNLSASQFRQPRLMETIKRILQETQLSPTYLELEITETALMKNVELTKAILNELHDMGVSIALDDFGTGYSSLSYLKAFPFHTLKIDKSFVCDVTTDPNDKAIVAAIVAMGKVLNLKLVAEGVETEMQEYLLRSLGCEEVQGYLFSRPVTAEEATRLLEKNDLRSSKLSLIA